MFFIELKDANKARHPPSSSVTCCVEGFGGEVGVSLLAAGVAASDWLRRSE